MTTPVVDTPPGEAVLVAVRGHTDVVDLLSADRSWDRMHVLLAATKAGDAIRDATRALHGVRDNAVELGIDDDVDDALLTLGAAIGQLDTLRLRCRQVGPARADGRPTRPT